MAMTNLDSLTLSKPIHVGSKMESFLSSDGYGLVADIERRLVFVTPNARGVQLVVPFEGVVAMVVAPAAAEGVPKKRATG